MFWNKKEIKEVKNTETKEAKPKETALYKRIKALYLNMNNLNCQGYYTSNLGERKFKITKERDYGDGFCYCQQVEYDYYKVVFTNEDFKEIKCNGIFYVKTGVNIFTLNVWKHKTKLEPCPINLTAHEIDLAILEFENYIEKIYNEHNAKIKELGG